MKKYPKYITNMLKNGWTIEQADESIRKIELGIENRLNLYVQCSVRYGLYDDYNDHDTFILDFYQQLVRMKYFLGVLENAIH